MRIVTVTHYPGALRCFIDTAAHLDRTIPDWGGLVLFDPAQPLGDTDVLAGVVSSTDAIIVGLMRSDPAWQDALTPILDGYPSHLLPFGMQFVDQTRPGQLRLAPGTMPPMMPGAPPRPPRGMDDSQARRDAMTSSRLARVYRTIRGGDTLFVFGTLLHDYGDQPDLDVPEPSPQTPGMCLADPATQARYASAKDYLATHPGPKGRPVVALLYNEVSYPTDPEPVAARLAETLSGDAQVLPVATETDTTNTVDRTLELCATPGLEPDLVMTLMDSRFSVSPTGGDANHGVAALNRLSAPYLSPILLTRTTAEEWLHHSNGLGPSEVLVSVMLPEFNRAINQVPIAAVAPPRRDARHRVNTAELQVIDEQLNQLVGRVWGLLQLRGPTNAGKRVCLIGYDYPAGEGNLLAASQLDVTESIAAILAKFHQMGYRTQSVTAARLCADLMADQVSSPAYLTEIQLLTYPHRQTQANPGDQQAWDEVIRTWPADGPHPMVDSDGDYLIPHIEYGNVLVSIQPGRTPEVNDALAHGNTVLPRSQCLTCYT